MNKSQTIKNLCKEIKFYHLDRIKKLCEDGQVEDAFALYNEVKDWFFIKQNHKIITIK
jgi:pentatricopeptide repeat protein